MRQSFKLELAEARHMIAAAIRKSAEIGVAETVCVTDDGGYPLALERMDGARITGPQIAWNKAFTAAGHKRSTHLFNQVPTDLPCPATRRSVSSGVLTENSPCSSAAFRLSSTTRSSAASG